MKKSNIAFYLKNKRIENVDCRKIEDGNPGIGGTFYSMIALSTFLSKRKDNLHNYIVYAEAVDFLPDSINKKLIDGEQRLHEYIISDCIDILVVNRITNQDIDERFLKTFRKFDVKLVIWAHCFVPTKMLRIYSRYDNVAGIVCVGKEQLLQYQDHAAFKKSTSIFNGIHIDISKNLKTYSERPNNVVYVGSLVRLKGFHLLARAWKHVLREVPDAKLFVIGSGRLYNRNSTMGVYGIAEKNYESVFIKDIIDGNGSIISSVRFLGILGAEKNTILGNAKVGVPNPSGETETFGYTAIEFQLAGAMVVTKSCPGYLDTVPAESGILYSHTSELAKSIISLLKRDNYKQAESMQYIRDRFSFEIVSEQWESLFSTISSEGGIITRKVFETRDKSWFSKIARMNKTIKEVLPFGYILPSILFYSEIFKQFQFYIRLLSEPKATVVKVYDRYVLRNNQVEK